MTSIDLNTPPMGPGGPGTTLGESLPPGVPPPSLGDVPGIVSRATAEPIPTMASARQAIYTLPCGMVVGDQIFTEASVRELTGFDEEALARINMNENTATYTTALLEAGVERIGDVKPTREDLRGLLIGDRDALVLAIRRATYGDEIDFTLDCDACDSKSSVIIDLTEDVEMVEMKDARERTFEVPISSGSVQVALLTGHSQEAFSDGIGKKVKTQAEINTLMLAKSVTEINGVRTYGDENSVRALTSGDRAKILDFVADIQPGPQLQKPVLINCATCGKEYPIPLGLASMFRF
jgi:hypothetical protein